MINLTEESGPSQDMHTTIGPRDSPLAILALKLPTMSLKRLAKKDDLLDDSPGTQVLAADRSGEPRLETGKADADAGDGGEWREIGRAHV